MCGYTVGEFSATAATADLEDALGRVAARLGVSLLYRDRGARRLELGSRTAFEEPPRRRRRRRRRLLAHERVVVRAGVEQVARPSAGSVRQRGSVGAFLK